MVLTKYVTICPKKKKDILQGNMTLKMQFYAYRWKSMSLYVTITITEAEDGSDGGDEKHVEKREAASFLHCDGGKLKN